MVRSLPSFRFQDLDAYVAAARIELNNEPDVNSMRRFRDMLSSDPIEGLKGLERLSDQGSIVSMTYLGWIYSKGRRVEIDETRSRYWFTRAADAGSANAVTYLAQQNFKDGNFKDAFELYRKAAKEKSVTALCALAIMYKRGLFVERNIETSLMYFEEAASLGHVYAIRDIIYAMIGGVYGIKKVVTGILLLPRFVTYAARVRIEYPNSNLLRSL